MKGLLGVERVLVFRATASAAFMHLQEMGRQEAEGFALWVGALDPDGRIFRVQETIIPAQHTIRTREGVCVVVDGPELHRLNLWLYEHRMTPVAQLHSHPGRAYHSQTDDAFSVATTAGSLSIVVPDFARDPFALDRCAVYRLTGDGQWLELSTDRIRELISIEG